MSIVLRARNVVGEACSFCGVPNSIACRNPFTGVGLANGAAHPQPVTVAEDARTEATNYVLAQLAGQQQYPLPQNIGGSPLTRSTNATPFALLDEPLPAVNGAVVRVTLVAACSNAALSERKFWEKRAFLVRTAGTWAVLGGLLHFDDENATANARRVPTQTAGMSAVALAPSLPGGDIVRATATGLATPLFWVCDFEIKVF